MSSSVIPSPRSRFLRVRCSSCNHEQNVFDRPARVVHCSACSAVLASPQASKARWSAKVLKVLD